MAGSSNALDVSAPTPDLKYVRLSNVNVSNFVSVKLSGSNNYKIWKAQMLCLIKSQELLHIIDNIAEYPFPRDKYDNLVKGWIFGTMSDHVLNDLVDIDLAREVWMKLESDFGQPIRNLEDNSSYAHNVPALEVIAPAVCAIREDMKYMVASNVNVSNFVSVKLSGGKNYKIWSAQMFCLIDSHELLHIINDYHPFPVDKGVHMIFQYDKLVKGWIFGTMSYQMLKYYLAYNSAREVWKRLELDLRYWSNDIQGDSACDVPALEVIAPDVSAIKEDLKYMKAFSVNVSNFVSVKLSGRNNYRLWKSQMLCLIDSQELLHLTKDPPRTDSDYKYSKLVRGWILSTISDQLLYEYDYELQVSDLWSQLESIFTNTSARSDRQDLLEFKFRREFVRLPEIEDKDNIRLEELYEAAVEGCWWKAKSTLKINKNAATKAITEDGNTILHLAVEMGHNYFLEKLLEFLKDEKDIETRNYMGETALHIAAKVGNIHAAQLLLQKRKDLLTILDHNEYSPLDLAIKNKKINIYAYLSETALQSTSLDGRNQGIAIIVAIATKQYDLVEMLLEKYPEHNRAEDILKVITITFPTDLGFMESFIYPSFHDVHQKTVVRGSLLFHSSLLDKCVDDTLQAVKIFHNTCCSWLGKSSMILLVVIATLYPIYELICLLILMLRLPFSMLYLLLWKVLAVTVSPVKYIEKKKKEYKDAKKILSLICNQMGKSNNGYEEPIFEAVRQGTYEVVDEILFASPATITFKDEEGHNIIQSAIKYRSEKVYNLIFHIIERTESYRTMKDFANNNLVHLAGRLAPSFVLECTSGAALQLQRELIWLEEVKKLLLILDLDKRNIYEETPEMVFTREHQDLMKQGENWMKTTAESCSITAALIVTVVFAAAITVPGGSNQESGIPLFKKEFAFTIFALSNAFSLFNAATALLLFLSILTARFSEKDFLVSLPRRLILGLLTLFLSTTSMMVAFGAILFLVFCDQRPWMLVPICGFVCLPISVIVTIKVPLLVDLIRSTYFPIFGKQSYLESCKVNPKNTIFMQ